MSKKNNKSVIAPGTLSDAEQRLQALRDQQTALETQIEQAKVAEQTALVAKVNALPAHFGVADIPAVIALIRRAGKTGNGSRKGRTAVTPEIRASVIALAKAGELTRAQIAAKTGISTPSVMKVLSAEGMVSKRK